MKEKSCYWFFEDVNLFNLLCPHRFKEYSRNHKFYQFRKGDYIYLEDETSNQIYLIVSGKVKIAYFTDDGKEVVKAILSRGEIFGELALLGEGKRTDFAIALENDTQLCPLTIELMDELMRKHKELSFKIYKLIGFRIKKLERRIESLIFKDVKTRLIEFLRELAETYGIPVGTETLIKHSFTQQDIADLIGASRQTVTTLLNELKEKNYIYFDRKRILVRDLHKLQEAVLSV